MPPTDSSLFPAPCPDDRDAGHTDPLPDSATALAAIVKDPSQSPQRREAAWRRLQPVIEQIAQRVAAHAPQQLKIDFCEETVGYVWERIGQFDAKRGSRFEAWCYQVLCNRLRDLKRRKRVAGQTEAIGHDPDKSDETQGPPDRTDRQQLLQRAIERTEPFSKADMDRIRRWPVRTRLFLLTVSGLWFKVSAQEWRAWMDEDGLEPPFPPERMLELDNPPDRTALLAEYLGEIRNTLSQQWCRQKKRLLELDYIRQLTEEHN